MKSPEIYDIGIVGAGAWGTTLASHLAQSGHRVLLWAYEPEVAEEINSGRTNSVYLPGFDLNEGLTATNDIVDLKSTDRLIVAVPSSFFASTINMLALHLRPGTMVVSATKGFIDQNLLRPSEYLQSILPKHPVGVLSGPNLAREIASGLPAISLIASKDQELVSNFQKMLSTERFRVYGGADVIGPELGGALKNIIAIAGGLVSGLELGENTLAALITRGIAEMIKLGKLLGAAERTFFGISGLGDLVCTSQSILSRNHQVGKRIAAGEVPDEILGSTSAVAEGVPTTKNVHAYATRHDLDLPITRAVYGVLFENASPEKSLNELMTRTLKME